MAFRLLPPPATCQESIHERERPMADDRNRREQSDDYSGAEPGQRDRNEDAIPGPEDMRGVADEGDEEFDDDDEEEAEDDEDDDEI